MKIISDLTLKTIYNRTEKLIIEINTFEYMQIRIIQLVLNHFFPLFLKLTRKSFFFSNLKYFHFFLRERSLKTKLLSYKLNKYSWLLSILTKFSVAKSFYCCIIIKISFDGYNGIYSLRNDQSLS